MQKELVAPQIAVLPLSVAGGVKWRWHKYDIANNRLVSPAAAPQGLTDEPMPDKETGLPVMEMVWNTHDWNTFEGYKIILNGDIEPISGDGLQKRLDWLLKRNTWAHFEIAQYQDVYVITGTFILCHCQNHKCGQVFKPHTLIDPEIPQGHIDTLYCPTCATKGE